MRRTKNIPWKPLWNKSANSLIHAETGAFMPDKNARHYLLGENASNISSLQVTKAVQSYGEKLTKDPRCRLVDSRGGEIKGNQRKGSPERHSLLQVAWKARSGVLCTLSAFKNQVEAAAEAARVAGAGHPG